MYVCCKSFIFKIKSKIMKDKLNYKPNIFKEKEHKKNGARFYFSFKAEGMSLF